MSLLCIDHVSWEQAMSNMIFLSEVIQWKIWKIYSKLAFKKIHKSTQDTFTSSQCHAWKKLVNNDSVHLHLLPLFVPSSHNFFQWLDNTHYMHYIITSNNDNGSSSEWNYKLICHASYTCLSHRSVQQRLIQATNGIRHNK